MRKESKPKTHRCTECGGRYVATSPKISLGCCFSDSVVKVKRRAGSKKLYDVFFTLSHPAVAVVEATYPEEARENFHTEFNDKKELLRRLGDALDFGGVEVIDVKEL